MNQLNNTTFISKYDEYDKNWAKKSSNKAKLINRQVKKLIKSSMGDIDILKGRIFVEHDSDCIMGNDCKTDTCNGCNSFFITDIEMDAIVDIGIITKDKYVNMMIISESKMMKENMSEVYYNNFKLVLVKEEDSKILYDNKDVTLDNAIADIVKIIKNIK